MEISIIKKAYYVGSTGINEHVPPYETCDNPKLPASVEYPRVYLKGEEYSFGSDIYVRNTDIRIKHYDPNYPSYKKNDILYGTNGTKGCIKYIIGLAGDDIAKQPSEYHPPSTLDFGTWNNRYTKLGTYDETKNLWTKTTGNITHSFRQNAGGTDGTYTLTKKTAYSKWTAEASDTSNRFMHFTSTGSLVGQWGGQYNIVVDKPYAAAPSVGTVIVGTDGHKYKVGTVTKVDVNGSDTTTIFAISRENIGYTTSEVSRRVKLLSVSDISIAEEPAYCYNPSNCSQEWFPRTIIKEGSDIYARTDTNDPVLTEKLTVYRTAIITLPYQAGGWGWTYKRPVSKHIPLDGKKYTSITMPSPITYTVKADSPFDTIAINGVLADNVKIEFTPDDGSAAIPAINIKPQTNIDFSGLLPHAPITVIAYAPRFITGSVKITMTSTADVSISGIELGQNTFAGFTNLIFTNKFKDYSPYEKDQWGNIVYIEGVKTNIFEGTVDIEITDYDMIHRLMTFIGGKKVIINGSDTPPNHMIDDIHYFSATMMVGRIKGYALKTAQKSDRISHTATYSVQIEEDA